jgi:hypothetical protein
LKKAPTISIAFTSSNRITRSPAARPIIAGAQVEPDRGVRARGRCGAGVSGVSGTAPAGSDAFASAVAKDLAEHKGRAVVIAGDSQPPAVHALAHAINAAIGAPVSYVATPENRADEQSAAFTELVADINAGRVQML